MPFRADRSRESLSPFMEINPYKEALTTANSFYDELADPEKISVKPMDTEKALNTVRRIQVLIIRN